MKMLRYSGLAVLVVCIAAFASGCGGGGGGGGTADEEMTPVMECPSPQVGTYPDCMDPPPTDAQLIAEAQDDLDDIVSDARTREGAARSAAAAVQVHPDATAAQISSALASAVEAQNRLTEIENKRDEADAATTPAEAESALDDARALRADLISAQSAVAAIQSAVNAVAEARRQREASEAALTNNSGLIKHLRDNKLLADAVLAAPLAIGSIVVGPAGNAAPSSTNTDPCAAPCAEYRADIGTGADRVTGQRTVRVEGLVSSSTTPSLSGTSRLSSGFDMKNADGTTFVNAYTDISKESRSRNSAVNEDDDATLHDERYNYKPDTDYLLAGIWLTVDNAALGDSTITAFAYGGQPTSSDPSTFCSGNENSGESGTGTTSVTNRVCGPTTGFNTISTFVKDGQDVTATYNGNANGAYLAGSDTSYFTADVTLTAEFQNPTGAGTDGTGSIVGAVTNIVAGGQRMDGSIELQEQSLVDVDDISGNNKFAAGSTIGVVDGKSFSGDWKGQFFGMTRVTRSQETTTAADVPNAGDTTRTITTEYSPQAPGSVAGTFYATQQSAPVGDAAFIGSFAAHR